MPIKIRIGTPPAIVTLDMNIRKSVNGDLMIFEHGDIDIVLSLKNNKIVTFPKENMSDLVYGAQNRLFKFLGKKGLITPETIKAGAYYGSIEGTLQESNEERINVPKLALVNISAFVEEERPYFEAKDAIISMSEDEYLDPDKEDSTELGDVPHRDKQGSIRKGYVRDPTALSYLYTM